ncbi:MAG: L,D-transpeptidase [Myxococcota bacterium]
MSLYTAFFYLVLLFQISCGNKSKNNGKDEKIQRKEAKINRIETTAYCQKAEEEKKHDFSQEKIKPQMWSKEFDIVNELDQPHIHPTPDATEIMDALQGIFRKIPRRGNWYNSLAASKPARIYSRPSRKSLELGRIRPRTRFPTVGYYKGSGCSKGWLRIGLEAYVCTNSFRKSRKMPTTKVFPVVKKGRITPGKYAYVRVGGAKWYPSRSAVKQKKPGGKYPHGFYVHFKRFTRINNKNYWKTIKNRYVPVDRIAGHKPSKYTGVKLGGKLRLPISIVIAKDNKGRNAPINVYDKPGGKKIGSLPARSAVNIFGEKFGNDGAYYRIGKCKWIRSRYVASAFPAPVPPGVKKHEMWIDINLGRQTLVLYHEKKPIFATIISTGRDEHSTKHGIFRIWWKASERDMQNEVGEEAYLAASVPWSMFFWKGQALHGTYWHNQFGRKKSHGCVNLSARDARYLYELLPPFNGPNWDYIWLGKNNPGPVVQIRRNDEDRPMIFGVAASFITEENLKKMKKLYKKRLKKETLNKIKNSDGKIKINAKKFEPGTN